MTKEQKTWFNWGYSDQKTFQEHPESVVQESWDFYKESVDCKTDAWDAFSWDTLFNNFPYYKNGVLKATKDLKLEY